MVRIALNGFSGAWNTFVKGVVSREHKPSWERVWDDFIQEETREESLYGNQQKGDDEENDALASQERKGKVKAKMNTNEEACIQEGKKKDMRKVY